MPYTPIAILLAAALLSFTLHRGFKLMSESLKAAEAALSLAVATVVTDVSAGLSAIAISIADHVANGTAAAAIQAQADKLNALDTSILDAEAVSPPAIFVITSTALPDAVVGAAYKANIGFSGGTAPLTVTSVPPANNGLTVGADGGVTGNANGAGDSSFAITATDGATPAQTATGLVTVHAA